MPSASYNIVFDIILSDFDFYFKSFVCIFCFYSILCKKADAEASAFKSLQWPGHSRSLHPAEPHWKKPPPFSFQFQYSVFSFKPMSAARNTGFLPALRCSV